MKKVAIFNMLYFLAYHLTKKLLEEGIEVIGIDRLNPDKKTQQDEMLMSIGRNAQLQFINQHMVDLDMKAVCQDVDTIFFFCPSDYKWYASLVNELKDREAVVQKMMTQCQRNNIRLIYVSSQMVYGQHDGMITEESSIQPELDEAIFIAQEEQRMIDGAIRGNFPLAVLRLPTVYGLWQPAHTFISQLLQLKIKGKIPEEIEIDDHLENNYIFVDDVVDALIRIGESEFTFDVYNLSNEEEDQLTKLMSTLFHNNSFFQCDKIGSQRRKVSNRKIKQKLNFMLRYSIERGICTLWTDMEKLMKYDRTLFF